MSTAPFAGRMNLNAITRDLPRFLVWLMVAGWASLFSWLAVERHEAWWTGRFDLGNMVQAIWSTAQGHPLQATDAAGAQISRLGSHVDPLLMAFAPLQWVTTSPVPLLVAQALIVALGALPAFWLGRLWLRDDRLAVAAAAAYLLYVPLQWAVLTDFHAVTLAAPLLMYAIWAAETHRDVVLGVTAGLALMSKEQVGLSIAMLGLWIAIRHRRRIAGAVLAVSALAWTAIAVLVIIPAAGSGLPAPFAERYGKFGATPAKAIVGAVTNPMDLITTLGGWSRLSYLLILLLPLLLLPLAAPLLAVCALPDLLMNMLAEWWPNYSVEFHYAAVPSPYLIAAALLGLSHLREHGRPPWLGRVARASGGMALALVAAGVLATMIKGPLPWFQGVSAASPSRLAQYERTATSEALDQAAALIPDDAIVSAGNSPGGHLSARTRILVFPAIDDAEWVIVDRTRPDMYDRLDPRGFQAALDNLARRTDFRVVWNTGGVVVFHRVRPQAGT